MINLIAFMLLFQSPNSTERLSLNEVAVRSPHHAYIAAEMIARKESPGERTVYLTPVRMTAEGALNRRMDDREAQRLNALIQSGELRDLVFKVAVGEEGVTVCGEGRCFTVARSLEKRDGEMRR